MGNIRKNTTACQNTFCFTNQLKRQILKIQLIKQSKFYIRVLSETICMINFLRYTFDSSK